MGKAEAKRDFRQGAIDAGQIFLEGVYPPDDLGLPVTAEVLHTEIAGWKRGEYLFDGSVAGLAGIAPGNPLYRLWKEIGVVPYCQLYYQSHFGHICFPDGMNITVHSDPNLLEKQLLEYFPLEKKAIHFIVNGLRSSSNMDMPFFYQQGFRSIPIKLIKILSMLMYIPDTHCL